MTRAQRRRIAAAMMVLGVLLIVVGAVGAAFDGGDDPVTAAPATTMPKAVPASTTPRSVPAATTSAPSTTEATSTIATTTTTSTTTLPPETVEEFALAFAAALERGDANFVFDRLHQVVVARYDEASCRATVEDRVLLITDYRLNGPVSGPESVEFTVSDRIITVSELFRAPVVFGFQGTEVEAEGVFARVDGEMRWFTDCT